MCVRSHHSPHVWLFTQAAQDLGSGLESRPARGQRFPPGREAGAPGPLITAQVGGSCLFHRARGAMSPSSHHDSPSLLLSPSARASQGPQGLRPPEAP